MKNILIFILLITLLSGCGSEPKTTGEEKVKEFKAKATDNAECNELSHDGKIYRSYGVATSAGDEIGITDRDSKIYDIPGYDYKEWVIEFHNDIYTIYKEVNTTLIPLEIAMFQEYSC